jgi:RNA polymerase sigma factor (sigma-70 family)
VIGGFETSLMNAVGPELLTRLLDEHGAALVLYAQQWCGTPEDVVQEAFLRLVRQKAVPENVAGWLYRVVRNGAISASRSAARRRRHEAAAADRRECWFKPSESERLDAATATRLLGELPIEQRETVVARLWGGLRFDEIAELTGSSTSTAHRRYQAGLAALRERLGVACPEKDPASRRGAGTPKRNCLPS